MDGGWFLFDDETVYEVDQEDVIEGNFGVRMICFLLCELPTLSLLLLACGQLLPA